MWHIFAPVQGAPKDQNMEQPLANGGPAAATPRFYVTPRQRINPGSILLAIVLAAGSLSAGLYALSHSRYRRLIPGSAGANRCDSATASHCVDKDDDDPSKVDTIYLGDPADAPSPGRPGNHVSPVHPFIVVQLPRFGDQVGLIPDTPAGRLLYAWLAAFNQADRAALAKALPEPVAESTTAAELPIPTSQDSTIDAQMELRKKTGGYNLLSAKEVKPGVLVFRLRDQTPAANEALGTLQVLPKSNPAAIATFSLREIPSP